RLKLTCFNRFIDSSHAESSGHGHVWWINDRRHLLARRLRLFRHRDVGCWWHFDRRRLRGLRRFRIRLFRRQWWRWWQFVALMQATRHLINVAPNCIVLRLELIKLV